MHETQKDYTLLEKSILTNFTATTETYENFTPHFSWHDMVFTLVPTPL